MDSKKFTLLISCLTAAVCILIIVYNYSSMPPYGSESVTAVPLFTSQEQISSSSESSVAASGGAVTQSSQDSSQQNSTSFDNTTATNDTYSSASYTSKTASTSTKKASTKSTKKSSSKATPQNPVNINTANLTQLESIPCVGPKKAQAILDYRSTHGSFSSINELDNVKGFGAATINKISKYIKLG